jgi:predicted TIM-barrel fold metal-dependent hydrolase
MIFDIDSHFEPGRGWLDSYPKLKTKLPPLDSASIAVEGIAGDLLRMLPELERPSNEDLAPPGAAILFGKEKAAEADRRAEFEGRSQRSFADAAGRVKWLDEQGIDLQNVICLAGFGYELAIGEGDLPLLREVVGACNDWLADTCDEAGGRLLPVATLEYSDLDWTIAELTRMRARGSRIFMIPGYPVGGIPPCHPHWDRLWSASVDLGMTPMLHIGLERMDFNPGWANLGTDTTRLRYFASSFGHVGAQMLINSFIFNGVFERHPKLTVLFAELGTGWLPYIYRDIDGRLTPSSQLFLGKYDLPLKPSEYLARNVRASPLSWSRDQPLLQTMEELPEDMLVFSSDFPHFEGFTDPMGYYAEQLGSLSQRQRDRFYGGSMLDVYARMGDPIE